MSSLSNLSDPKKRASFAKDIVYEIKEMESPVKVKSSECNKKALLKTAKKAKSIPFDYDHLIVSEKKK
ncbi:MAG: hypothetical protein HQL69_23650 [Magnetococcales bacterium]|nr:hypothetical protein [Magnetococcales bacterium]